MDEISPNEKISRGNHSQLTSHETQVFTVNFSQTLLPPTRRSPPNSPSRETLIAFIQVVPLPLKKFRSKPEDRPPTSEKWPINRIHQFNPRRQNKQSGYFITVASIPDHERDQQGSFWKKTNDRLDVIVRTNLRSELRRWDDSAPMLGHSLISRKDNSGYFDVFFDPILRRRGDDECAASVVVGQQDIRSDQENHGAIRILTHDL